MAASTTAEDDRLAGFVITALQRPDIDMLQHLVADGFDISRRLRFPFYGIIDYPYYRRWTAFEQAATMKKWIHAEYLLDLHLAGHGPIGSKGPGSALRTIIIDLGNDTLSDKFPMPPAMKHVVGKLARVTDEQMLCNFMRLFGTRKSPEILNALIEGGANVKLLGSIDYPSPITSFTSAECMRIFLKNGLNVNCQDPENGFSALHKLFSNDEYHEKRVQSCMRILLVYGVDLNLRDDRGKKATEFLTDAELADFESVGTEMQEARAEARRCLVAFCMLSHKRLGAESRANMFPPELFANILGHYDEESATLRVAGLL